MRVTVRPVEVVAERWASGMMRYGVETTLGASSMVNVHKVLWMEAPRLRKVGRRSKNTLYFTLSQSQARHMVVRPGDHVELIPRRGGEFIIRKASERKVRNALSKFGLIRCELGSGGRVAGCDGTGE